MRFQTSFEKLAQTTNGQIFTVCFVGLRIVLGVSCLYLVAQLPDLPSSQLWDDRLWLDFVAPVFLLAIGISFVLGLLVRPFAVLAMLITVTFTLTLVDVKVDPQAVFPMIGLILLLGLFTAGGAGHVFGLDAIVLRNLRRANYVTKFLFG